VRACAAYFLRRGEGVSGGGRRRQNHRGTEHAGDALCRATVPLRKTTVEKLETRKGEGRGGERAGGGGGQKRGARNIR